MKAGKTLHIILIVLSVMFLTGHFLLNSKKIQQDAACHAVRIAQNALGTDVTAGRVQLVYPFGIRVENLTVYDTQHDTLAHAASVSLRFKPTKLLRNHLSVTSIRVNSPILKLSRDSVDSDPNYAFLYALRNSQSNRRMSFRANSILIRNASVKYDLRTAPQTDSKFNPNHLNVSGLTANLSLKSFSADSIAFIVRKLSFDEQSGFRLTQTKGTVSVGSDWTDLSGFTFSTPNGEIQALQLLANIGLDTIPHGIPAMSADIRACLAGADLKAFVPGLSGMTAPLDLALTMSSTGSEINVSSLSLKDQNNNLEIGAYGSATIDSTLRITENSNANVQGTFSNGMPEWLESQLAGFGIVLPQQLRSLGSGSFQAVASGTPDNPKASLTIDADAGKLLCTLTGNNSKYHGEIVARDIKLAKVTGKPELGNLSMKAQTDLVYAGDSVQGVFCSMVQDITYKDYTYRGINISGAFNPHKVQADLDFCDSNGSLAIISSIDMSGSHSYDLTVRADTLNLSAYKLVPRDSMSLSAVLTARLNGENLDALTGRIQVDSLDYADLDGNWHMDNMTMSIGGFNDYARIVAAYADFMNVSVVGNFSLSQLPASVITACNDVSPVIGKMLSDILGTKALDCSNVYSLEAGISNTDFMGTVFHYPVSLGQPAHMLFSINDTAHTCSGTISVPQITIKDQSLTDINLVLDSQDGACKTGLNGIINNTSEGDLNLDFSWLAFTDIIRGTYSWSNSTGNLNGNAKTISQFFDYDARNGLKSMTLIDSTRFTMRNTMWNFGLTDIRTDNHKISISGFRLSNASQYLYADGMISSDSTDILSVAMKGIDLNRSLNTFQKNDVLALRGIASGRLSVAGLTGKPAFYGSVEIDSLQFMNSYHGNLMADCYWNRQTRQMEIAGIVNDPGVSRTGISGYYTPHNKNLDIYLDAFHADIGFLNTWTRSIFKEIGGRTTGSFHFFGQARQLDMEGDAIVENAFFTQEAINATFLVRHDTVQFEPGRMLFRNVEVYDEYGHDGLMTCTIRHDKFRNWRVDMTADVADMLVYNQPRSEKSPIFASVYAEGSMNLRFNPRNGLTITANARTAPGTRIGYTPTSGSVNEYGFLTIVDRNTLTIDGQSIADMLPGETKKGNKVNLNFNIQCSEDALIEMSTASLTGFFRGNGDISLAYDAKDGPVLNGLYNLSYGKCSLSLEDVIRKNFTLMDGSYVRFNGALSDTELDLQTYHNVNSVSIYDLDPTTSTTNNVRVRCLMGISGRVADPQITFNIDMPNGTTEERDILASATATEEQRNIQFMYLLAIGRFYTYDTNTGLAQNNTPSAMESLVNSTVSGQINNLLSQVLNNENVTLSSNVSASSYLSNDATNLSNKELEGILEAHLFNNRLLVNGNFGYRENAINNTSNFIGDFEVKYLLLPKHGISIRGYNKTNDKYFTKATLTTQGVGLVFEKDF